MGSYRKSRLERLLGLGLIALLLVGCAEHTAYRRGDKAVEYITLADLTSRCVGNATLSWRPIPVAYVEIDEQGYFHDSGQVDRALAVVSLGPRPQYVVVFVHGWFHNASKTDEHLLAFKCALNDLQAMDSNVRHEVIGIYIG